MLPLTKFKPKPMLPILNKPVLEYVIEKLKASGIDEIICVIGEKGGGIRDYFSDLIFVEQRIPLGTADAVLRCRGLIKDDFLLVWGDHLFEFDIKKTVEFHKKYRCDATLSLQRVEHPERIGVAEVDGSKIIGVCEKPRKPKTDIGTVGSYILSPVIFDYLEDLNVVSKGEYEFTDGIQKMIAAGCEVRGRFVRKWRKNLTTPFDLLEVNLRFLNKKKKKFLYGENCKIDSDVHNSVIGNNCSLKNCEIEDSLILDDVEIKNSKIKGSVINYKSRLSGMEVIDEIV